MPLMKHIRSTPREALNWRLFLTIFVVGLAGLGRGTDEGLIGSLTGSKEWLNEFKVANGSGAQSNVVSMVQLGNIPGALLAFFAVDRIGRLNTIRVCALIWILGIAIWITSAGSLGQTYGGRFVAGIGIGAFSVVCPTYLSEISPRTIRGLAVTVFSAMVYLGITLSYFANYGAQSGFPKQSTKVWRVPVGMNFVYAGLLFLGTFLIKESPRALVKRGKAEEALETLAWYRNLPRDHPYLRDEFNGIMEENHREAQAMEGHTYWTVFKHLFTRSANLYRLIVIGFGIQILGQWSGGGSLTIYAQKIFVLVGVKTNASLYTTGIFGVVKLTSGLCCAFFLVDLLGRKRSVFIGIGLQTLAALYLAVFLSTVNPSANAAQSATQERASIAAIVMIFISGVGWALGFNTIQYLIGTEIWPMELRAMASSLIMCVHFGEFAFFVSCMCALNLFSVSVAYTFCPPHSQPIR